jgi:hypothetical protein
MGSGPLLRLCVWRRAVRRRRERVWAFSLGGKQRAVRGGVELGEPGPENLDGLPDERCCPVLAALAVTTSVRAGAQVDVLAGEAGHL